VKAVLLIGGEGTRLRPLTCNTVKAMVPILNRPFLEHVIAYLKSHGVDDIVLALCYLPDHVQSYFGDGSKHGVRLTYAVEDSPRGTAGAVKNVEGYLDDVFLVFNGDILTDIDLTAMMAFHRARKANVTIALTPVEDPSAYGVVETEADGRVRRFVEKPPREEATTNLINAGVYILDSDVLPHIPANERYMFEHDLYPKLLARGVPVYGFPSEGYWIDIGTPEKYLQLHCDLLQGKGVTALHSAARPSDPASVAHGGWVHPTARVEGPVVLGHGCHIGPAAYLKGPVVLGEDCIILEGAAIEGSVLWHHVRVGRQAVLRHCIVGDSTSIGDGSQLDTGSVVGDHVVISPGSYLAPGTRLGDVSQEEPTPPPAGPPRARQDPGGSP